MQCLNAHEGAKYRIHVTFPGWQDWPIRSVLSDGTEVDPSQSPLPVYGMDILCCSDEELMRAIEDVHGLGHNTEVFTLED